MTKQAGIVIVILVLACAAGGVAVWMKSQNQTSLPVVTNTTHTSIAAPKPASLSQSAPSIHIEGCQAYIQPPLGEKMEPRLMPGASIDDFRRIYGHESKHDGNDWQWDKDDFYLYDFDYAKGAKSGSILLESNSGHFLATPDGIVLGRDTYQDLLRKMKDRGVEVTERLADEDMVWVLTVSFPSTCNPNLRSKYVWMTNDTEKTDEEIGNDPPFNSKIFLDQVVNSYSIETYTNGDEILDGPQATHK